MNKREPSRWEDRYEMSSLPDCITLGSKVLFFLWPIRSG
jgi:hypothetical protein